MDPRHVLARVSTLDCAKAWIRRDNGFKDNYQVTKHGRLLCTVIDRLCRHLTHGDGDRRVVVQLPTQHSKSIHFSEIFPARAAGLVPTVRLMPLGYDQEFAKRTVRNTRKIMTSREYRATYKTRISSSRTIAGSELRNSAGVVDFSYCDGMGAERVGGQMLAGSLRAPPNGEAADVVIIDDPYKGWSDATSAAYNELIWGSWNGTVKLRGQGPGTLFVLPHTPWTSDDLSSRIMDQWDRAGVEYILIRLPARSREDTPEEVARGGRPYDFRTELGVSLWPEKFGEEHYDELYASATRRVIDAHLDLCPKESAGTECPANWWRFFEPGGMHDTVALVCDPNGTEGGPCFASAGIWDAHHASEGYIHFRRHAGYRAKPGYTAFKEGILQLLKLYPKTGYIIIEATGHGESAKTDVEFHRQIREILKREPVYIWKKPKASKKMRHDVAISRVRQGHIFLPIRSDGRTDASWVHSRQDAYTSKTGVERDENLGWIEEWERGAKPDDTMCEGAMAVEELGIILGENSDAREYAEALAKLAAGGGTMGF